MVFPRVIQNVVDTSEKIKAPKDTVAAGLSNIGESINVESRNMAMAMYIYLLGHFI